MKTKIISMILLVAMVFSAASMGMVSSFAEEARTYPYHEAGHWTNEGGIDDQDYTFAFVGLLSVVFAFEVRISRLFTFFYPSEEILIGGIEVTNR